MSQVLMPIQNEHAWETWCLDKKHGILYCLSSFIQIVFMHNICFYSVYTSAWFFFELFLFVRHSNWKQSHVFQMKSETIKISLILRTYTEQISVFPDLFFPQHPLLSTATYYFSLSEMV